MSIIALIVALILLSGLTYFITLYNQLVFLKNEVQKNWSNIDVLLKQRNNELIKLIESCKEYMQYEQSTFEKIVQARNTLLNATDTQDLNALGKAETELRSHVGQLFALAENYPDLKSNEVFSNLQKRISELESSISDRREFYNDSVNINNVAIEQFPTNIVSILFKFKNFQLLSFNESDTKDISIKEKMDK